MGHTHGDMQDTIGIIQVARRGRHMNITSFVHTKQPTNERSTL